MLLVKIVIRLGWNVPCFFKCVSQNTFRFSYLVRETSVVTESPEAVRIRRALDKFCNYGKLFTFDLIKNNVKTIDYDINIAWSWRFYINCGKSYFFVLFLQQLWDFRKLHDPPYFLFSQTFDLINEDVNPIASCSPRK